MAIVSGLKDMNSVSSFSREIVGIVLAGGRSSRMGRNKALLPINGIQLVDHMSLLLQSGGADRVIVSGIVSGVTSIPDDELDLGPLGGLKAVLSRFLEVKPVAFVIVPVDMPFLRPEHLRELSKRLTSNIDAVYFTDNELPVALHGTAKVHGIICELLAPGVGRGSRSIRALLARLNTIKLGLPQHDLREFMNVNTPEQWSAVRGVQ
jgi:molybdenum cofactor guanylyltransferase